MIERLAMCLVALATCCLGVSAFAQSQPGVQARTMLPEGDGPFPTVLWVHGCSGISLYGPATDAGRPGNAADPPIRRHHVRMAALLNDLGYGVVLPDILASEGITTGWCGDITSDRVADYIEAGLAVARESQALDASRIYIVGMSMGGGGLLAWLGRAHRNDSGVRGTIAIYPKCSEQNPLTGNMPLLMLLAQADEITPAAECLDVMDSAQNQLIETRIYQNSHHGFDILELPPALDDGGLTLGSNEWAAGRAWVAITQFLDGN